MYIVYLILSIAVLIFVHEFGHFIVAKKSGIWVKEFGFGLPPKIWGRRFGKGEYKTEYTLNFLPFGGFVRMAGEDAEEDDAPRDKCFEGKNHFIQGAVVSAGVLANIIFAWIIISFCFLSGISTSVSNNWIEQTPKDSALTILGVLPNTPAEKAGLLAGDKILFIENRGKTLQVGLGENEKFITGEEASSFITSSIVGDEISILVKRKEETKTFIIKTIANPNIPNKSSIGISMDVVGTVKLPFFKAFYEGGLKTMELTKRITIGLGGFIVDAVKGEASMKTVSGPIGIAKMVKDASEDGFKNAILFVAILSLHLAVLNFIPFPALDGGRLLLIVIESIIRRRIKPSVSRAINIFGFICLMALMVFITYSDIVKLFN